MATFSVNVPDDQVQLIGEAFAQQFSFDVGTLQGQELLDAEIEFARQSCMKYIITIVRAHLEWKDQQTQPPVPDNPVNLT